MKHTFFFLRWSLFLAMRRNWQEAAAAFLEAFDKGRAERQALAVLRGSQWKADNVR